MKGVQQDLDTFFLNGLNLLLVPLFHQNQEKNNKAIVILLWQNILESI